MPKHELGMISASVIKPLDWCHHSLCEDAHSQIHYQLKQLIGKGIERHGQIGEDSVAVIRFPSEGTYLHQKCQVSTSSVFYQVSHVATRSLGPGHNHIVFKLILTGLHQDFDRIGSAWLSTEGWLSNQLDQFAQLRVHQQGQDGNHNATAATQLIAAPIMTWKPQSHLLFSLSRELVSNTAMISIYCEWCLLSFPRIRGYHAKRWTLALSSRSSYFCPENSICRLEFMRLSSNPDDNSNAGQSLYTNCVRVSFHFLVMPKSCHVDKNVKVCEDAFVTMPHVLSGAKLGSAPTQKHYVFKGHLLKLWANKYYKQCWKTQRDKWFTDFSRGQTLVHIRPHK